MEILRWAGRPGMALVNRIGDEDHGAEWHRALGQYFRIVRDFDALAATFTERVGLLEGFRELRPSGAPAIEAALDSARRRNAAGAGTRPPPRSPSSSPTRSPTTEEVAVADPAELQAGRDRLERSFHDALRTREARSRARVEACTGTSALASREAPWSGPFPAGSSSRRRPGGSLASRRRSSSPQGRWRARPWVARSTSWSAARASWPVPSWAARSAADRRSSGSADASRACAGWGQAGSQAGCSREPVLGRRAPLPRRATRAAEFPVGAARPRVTPTSTAWRGERRRPRSRRGRRERGAGGLVAELAREERGELEELFRRLRDAAPNPPRALVDRLTRAVERVVARLDPLAGDATADNPQPYDGTS